MRAPALNQAIRALTVLVLAVAGLGLGSSTASAASVSINLCAKAGTLTLPGPVSVPVWGFGVPATPGDCTTATAGAPGPVLSVNEGDTVTISVTNALPAGHTLAFEIPGVDFTAGPSDAAAGATVTRSFNATRPGTYLYRSGGDAGRQAAMGLYGALIVRPPTPNQAYDTATTAYNVEALLILSAIDPGFNAAPDTFDMHSYRATYWLINGRAYPDTTQITASPGQRVLLRYANAGYDNTTMSLLGMHERVVAQDARLLNNPFDANAETIPAGATADAIATVPSGTAPSIHGFPLYNRQQHLTNGPQSGPSPAPATGGGMLTFIHP
ncbi:multicopper oxidase domain-containing protein [Dactylosporangium sp. NPDC049140]|uniref:multicopper oxidase domain-containing protein n=1 Tax=Dactylosporangium sp. NPDC049140 TaxID=3155647 RepID=UPI0033F7E45A